MTDGGTIALLELDDRDTDRPDVGAGLAIVKVPVQALPPGTLAGLKVKPVRDG